MANESGGDSSITETFELPPYEEMPGNADSVPRPRHFVVFKGAGGVSLCDRHPRHIDFLMLKRAVTAVP
jgi:hypothetical protein